MKFKNPETNEWEKLCIKHKSVCSDLIFDENGDIYTNCSIETPWSLFVGGDDPPSEQIGVDGDVYINSGNGNLYHKFDGWTLLGNLHGNVDVSDKANKIEINNEELDLIDIYQMLEDLKNGEGELYDSLNQSIMNKSHPVGYVYMNALNDTDPYTLFGVGTWQKIEGAYPRGMKFGDTLDGTVKYTGKLGLNNLPEHNHGNTNNITSAPNGSYTSNAMNSGASAQTTSAESSHKHPDRLFFTNEAGSRLAGVVLLGTGGVNTDITNISSSTNNRNKLVINDTVPANDTYANSRNMPGTAHTHTLSHDHLMTHIHATNNAGSANPDSINPDHILTSMWIRVL